MLSEYNPSRRRFLTVAGVAAGVAAVVAVGSAPTAGAQSLPSGDAIRYQGYREVDRRQPYAKYMAERTSTAPKVVLDAFDGPPLAPGTFSDFDSITTDLTPSGYSTTETGYGQFADGVIFAAVKTVMPGVTPAMWDWWFGWHSSEAARYKLWHPDAHLYAGLHTDLTTANLSDKQKYVGNTSFVDEYVGPKLQQLGINFRDPVAHGFDVPDTQTLIFGRVGSSIAPVDLGWLAHQVRPITGGSEMRSRFYLNIRGLHVPDVAQAALAVQRGASVDPRDLVLGLDLAKDLMLHCGQEMNHLAGFLPEIYSEFSR